MDITGGFNSNQDTWAMVIESAWPEKLAIAITDVPRIKYCIDHWVKDIPWENCGAHEFQLKSRGRSQELIVKKFEHLDKVFEQVKCEGSFRTKNEINMISDNVEPTTMGYVVHIGPKGEIFYDGTSTHRFAVAYILKIPLLALVVSVHVSAIPYLVKYRKSKPSKQ